MSLITRQIPGLEAAALVNPFYKGQGASAQARAEDLFFAALLDDEIVGAVRFCLEENVPMLRSMMIHTDHRKRGIGHRLLQDFESYLETHSHRGTHCLPYGHLVRFYGLIGFEKIDEAIAPRFLVERLAGYRLKNPSTNYICMRRQ